MWVGRRYLDKRGMTLRSFETYGYIGSKTKSYQILRGLLLLFIIYAFWPYKAGFPCFLVFWPYKANLPYFLAFWPYKAGLPCFLNQQALLLITLLKPSLLGLSEFPDLFPILLGAPKLLPKSELCPNISLNHYKVPCHLSCGFGLFL